MRKSLYLAAGIFLLAAALAGAREGGAATAYGPVAQGDTKTSVRLYNGLICPLVDNAETFPGEIWVEGNRIVYAGPGQPANRSFTHEIDLKGNLVLPGFKNAHAHSPMTFLRSHADGLPLSEWLKEQVFPLEAKLKGDDVYTLYQLAVLEYLSSGITSALDMYYFNEDMIRAAVDTGFRAVFSGSISNFYGDAKLLEDQFRTFNQVHDRVSYILGFHAEYTASDSLLESIAALSRRLGEPVYFHNSETVGEVESCLAGHELTPIALFDQIGLLEHGGAGYHSVHVSKADLEIMRKKKVAAVTCPASNAKLASGIAPIKRMLDHGLLVALGTDGPASNNALDFFREMYLLAALQNIATGTANALTTDEILRIATRNGAEVMRLKDCQGLAPGQLADLIVIDLQQPNMQPRNDVMRNLVYAGSKSNVKMTMIDGRILYEDGNFHVGIGTEEVYARAGEIARRIIQP